MTLADVIEQAMQRYDLTMDELYDAVTVVGQRRGYITIVGGLEWHGEERLERARDRDSELAYNGA
ncbi:hypothetical protein [Alicyclobacillus fastidiosus]|uniref:Uncharacterized protein n=1 Tax=Alicyclobacillus fastidiosus TaxID=392011 RepID=A0ABV5AKC6_9BACL|nr:hypothetical protein [Alicyclobacillus fastidiosus]WEH09300.1 hypothetical protein PYS47_21930 [Alicyclobacillus fastidiosus]